MTQRADMNGSWLPMTGVGATGTPTGQLNQLQGVPEKSYLVSDRYEPNLPRWTASRWAPWAVRAMSPRGLWALPWPQWHQALLV